MRLLRNIPIKRKLNIIMMLTSSVALLLACIGFVTYEQVTFRRTMAVDLAVLTDMIEANVVSGLTFNETKSIETTLGSLNAHPHILAAAVYDNAGKVVVRFQRSDLKSAFQFPPAQKTGTFFGKNRLNGFRDVMLDEEKKGTIYIALDLRELSARFWRYGIIVGFMLLVSSLVAFALSARLQHVISGPISHLVEVAAAVAAKKDYSVRAVKQTEDELGRLVDGFNEMLNQIQQRETALQSARDDLERRVEERTKELASSLSLLNATLDSTADGILAVQLSGKAVSYNTKFAAMWGIPPDLLSRRDGTEIAAFLASQVRNSEQFLQRIEDQHAKQGSEAFDVIELKDGRTFERYIQPQRIGGESVGMVINFRDITERKQAGVKLQEAHKQLLDISRQAGMAEVATGVLHNVGNVLNSVNVSASLVVEDLKKSKMANLARVVALMYEHSADLGTYFTVDPKGKQLPGYLVQLSGHLAGEQEAIVKEMHELHSNIEHIKEIVAMQQSYAKLSGITELLKVTDLVEDTLRMNAGALVRHEVKVIREFDSQLPEISTDRHKVLQILVNLVRNAKYACSESGRTDKKLTVRVTNGDDRVRIAVTDNGMGIAPENLTRIFAHGFTTKKDGHGFGLHSGALAAKEMGGSLGVHSDGVGCGATFTLELPLQSPKVAHG
jgi:PAS domain S-box-containing protein